MVRRTGMFESPDNIVSVQRIQSAVGDTTSTWTALKDAAQSASRALQPLKNQNAQQQAQRDFQDGRVGLRLQLNAEDEIYNNAMTQSYLLSTSRDLDQRIMQLETDHAADVEGFNTAFEGVRQAAIEGAPNDLAPHLQALLDDRQAETTRRIGERVRNNGIAAYAQNATARLAQMEARLSGFDDVQSQEFQTAFGQYEEEGQAIIANPLSGITSEEWSFRRNNLYDRISANAVSLQAERMYEDGGGNAESAQRALAFVEEQMRNPDLVLTEAQRDASFNEARRRIGAMETERRRSERELRAEMRAYRAQSNSDARDMIAGAESLAQSFAVIPDDQMAELGQAVAGSGSAVRAREFNELQIENNTRRVLQGRSLTEIEAVTRDLREAAQGGDTDAAIALAEAERYRRNLSSIDAVTGLQQHTGQAPASLEYGLGPRIRQMEGFAEDVGRADVTYMTPGERELLAGRLRAGGDDALHTIQALVSEAAREPGDGVLRANRLLGEIAGAAGDEWAAVGGVYVRGGNASTETARLMSNALQVRGQDGNRIAALYPTNRADGMEQEVITSVIGSQGRAFMTGPELAQVRLAADLAYQGRALSDPSLYADQRSYENAYRTAVQSVLGGVRRQDSQGRWRSWGGAVPLGRSIDPSTDDNPNASSLDNVVVIPNWIRRDQFTTVYQSLRFQDFQAGSSNGALPANGELRDWRSARLAATGRRVGEYYLLNERGQAYITNNGTPYMLDLNRVRASLYERRRDAIAP